MSNNYQDKLSHLSLQEINDLMESYYGGEKNDLLIQKYKIDIRSSLLSKTFPFEVHDDISCPFCNVSMLSHRESKSSYSSPKIFCENCSHLRNNDNCNCENCKEEREKIQNSQVKQKLEKDNEKRELLQELFLHENSEPINTDTLSLKSKLYICSLLRACLSEDLSNIYPISQSKAKIAPTDKYIMDIISHLRDERVILFSPDTHLDSIIIEDNNITSYYPMNVTFRLNVIEDNYQKSVDSLMYLKGIDYISPKEKIQHWADIGISECLEFLYAKMEEYNLPSEYIGDKTISSIEDALNDYSVSQLYNFIWRAVNNSAAFCQKERISKKHAVNTIAGNISRNNEKAIAECWDVKGYGRDYNYPQTIISEVFFNIIIEIGGKGFSSVRSEN